MNTQGKELLYHIEILRDRLNKKIDDKRNVPKKCPATYELSAELDNLINLYMREYMQEYQRT